MFELLFFERKMCIINTKKHGKIITLLPTRLSDYKIHDMAGVKDNIA